MRASERSAMRREGWASAKRFGPDDACGQVRELRGRVGSLAARPCGSANRTQEARRRSGSEVMGATKLEGELRTRAEPVRGARKRNVGAASPAGPKVLRCG